MKKKRFNISLSNKQLPHSGFDILHLTCLNASLTSVAYSRWPRAYRYSNYHFRNCGGFFTGRFLFKLTAKEPSELENWWWALFPTRLAAVNTITADPRGSVVFKKKPVLNVSNLVSAEHSLPSCLKEEFYIFSSPHTSELRIFESYAVNFDKLNSLKNNKSPALWGQLRGFENWWGLHGAIRISWASRGIYPVWNFLNRNSQSWIDYFVLISFTTTPALCYELVYAPWDWDFWTAWRDMYFPHSLIGRFRPLFSLRDRRRSQALTFIFLELLTKLTSKEASRTHLFFVFPFLQPKFTRRRKLRRKFFAKREGEEVIRPFFSKPPRFKDTFLKKPAWTFYFWSWFASFNNFSWVIPSVINISSGKKHWPPYPPRSFLIDLRGIWKPIWSRFSNFTPILPWPKKKRRIMPHIDDKLWIKYYSYNNIVRPWVILFTLIVPFRDFILEYDFRLSSSY